MSARRLTGAFTSYGPCLLPRFSSKGRSLMRPALTAVAGVGVLAVMLGMETANAQPYRRYGAARTYTSQPYTPQSRGSVRREGVPRTVPFSDPNSLEATGGGSIGYNRTVRHWCDVDILASL